MVRAKRKPAKKVAPKKVAVGISGDGIVTFEPPEEGAGVCNADVIITGKE